MTYYVDDIRCTFGEVQTIEANSPLEAAKKRFPIARLQEIMTAKAIL